MGAEAKHCRCADRVAGKWCMLGNERYAMLLFQMINPPTMVSHCCAS